MFDISSELFNFSYKYLKGLVSEPCGFFDAYIVLNNRSSVFFSNVTKDFLIEQYEHLEAYGIKQFYFNFSREGE